MVWYQNFTKARQFPSIGRISLPCRNGFSDFFSKFSWKYSKYLKWYGTVPEFYQCSEIAELRNKINTMVKNFWAGKKHFCRLLIKSHFKSILKFKLFIHNPPLLPKWRLLRSPMLMDSTPANITQVSDIGTVFQLEQEVTRPKCKLWTYLTQDVWGGWGGEQSGANISRSVVSPMVPMII